MVARIGTDPPRPGSAYQSWLAGFLLLGLACVAHAGTPKHALAITYGQGAFHSRLSERNYVGLSYRQAWQPGWAKDLLPDGTELSLAYTLSRFHGCGRGICDQLTDVGFDPMLRYLPNSNSGASFYLDLGIGLHLISQTHISNEIYSTALQFRELIGIGCEFGRTRRYDLGLSLMHESNGDLKTRNDGMNFILLSFAIHW